MSRHPHLELDALRWLAWERKCIAVVRERNIRNFMGEPDALGITHHRHVIEVEIKRSLSDFRVNQRKPHIANREQCLDRWPRQFYFLTPKDISDRVQAELPDWAGLAYSDWVGNFTVVRRAPINTRSLRLTILECRRLMQGVRNHLITSEINNYNRSVASGLGIEMESDWSI